MNREERDGLNIKEVLTKQHFGELGIIDFLDRIFFHGLVTGYADFEIRLGDGNTVWTHEMLGYSRLLARRWGFDAKLERKRWDAMWLANIEGSKQPILRFEHENSMKWKKQWETVRSKLVECTMNEPTLVMLVGIVYPESEKAENRLLKRTQALCKKKLPHESALLLITDSAYYGAPGSLQECKGKRNLANLNGYTFTNEGRVRTSLAIRGSDPLGFYYAYSIQ